VRADGVVVDSIPLGMRDEIEDSGRSARRRTRPCAERELTAFDVPAKGLKRCRRSWP
jgi:hypothetical protein